MTIASRVCFCGKEIPPERLEVLPDATTCVGCSGVKRVAAFMVYSHKTAGAVMFIDSRNPEAVRQAKRAFRRAR